MTNQKCRSFESCNVPLCPIDDRSLEHGIWYSDEDICKLKKYKDLLWIKNQKQIAKCLVVDDGFFTMRMLEVVDKVTNRLKGSDPNNIRSEEKWLKDKKKGTS